MVKMVNVMLWVFYHNKINLSEPPPRVTTEESGLIATQQMLPAAQSHLHPNNPGVRTVFCAQDSPLWFLEMSQLQPCTA